MTKEIGKLAFKYNFLKKKKLIVSKSACQPEDTVFLIQTKTTFAGSCTYKPMSTITNIYLVKLQKDITLVSLHFVNYS